MRNLAHDMTPLPKSILSRKAREIYDEIFYEWGYNLYYVKPHFGVYNFKKEIDFFSMMRMNESEYSFRAVTAFTLQNLRITYHHDGVEHIEYENCVILSLGAMKLYSYHYHERAMIVQSLAHELAHVRVHSDKFLNAISKSYNLDEHNRIFCEVYSDIVNDYNLGYADSDYYLG